MIKDILAKYKNPETNKEARSYLFKNFMTMSSGDRSEIEQIDPELYKLLLLNNAKNGGSWSSISMKLIEPPPHFTSPKNFRDYFNVVNQLGDGAQIEYYLKSKNDWVVKFCTEVPVCDELARQVLSKYNHMIFKILWDEKKIENFCLANPQLAEHLQVGSDEYADKFYDIFLPQLKNRWLNLKDRARLTVMVKAHGSQWLLEKLSEKISDIGLNRAQVILSGPNMYQMKVFLIEHYSEVVLQPFYKKIKNYTFESDIITMLHEGRDSAIILNFDTSLLTTEQIKMYASAAIYNMDKEGTQLKYLDAVPMDIVEPIIPDDSPLYQKYLLSRQINSGTKPKVLKV